MDLQTSLTPNRTEAIVTTIRYHVLEQVTAWLKGNVGVRGAGGDQDHYWSSFAGRALLLWPLTDYTNSKNSEDVTTGASAKLFYRIVIKPSSVVGFLSIVSAILIWSGCCLWSVSVGAVAPNSSLFPEIDFGSKCVQFEYEKSETEEDASDVISDGMGVLFPLSNAESKDIVKELKGVNIYAGSARNTPAEFPHVILATKREEVNDLHVGIEYR